MLRICTLAAIIASLAAASAAAPAAHAVKVVNTTKQPIVSLRTSPPGKDDWGDDYLGDRTIKAGQSLTLQVKSDACTLDVQALLDNGDTADKAGVDICAADAAVTF